MKTPRELMSAISAATEAADHELASLHCEELITCLFQSGKEFPILEAESILTKLRGKRYFQLIHKVGNAFIESGRGSFTIHRQFAQAAIEQKQIQLAIFILNDLADRTSVSSDEVAKRENAEAKGLLGRAYKQLYVDTDIAQKDLRQLYFEKSISSYYEGYKNDPEQNIWHGINVLALIERARIDHLELTGMPDTSGLAKSLIEAVEWRDAREQINSWDYATAAEASVALKDWDTASKWIEKYVAHSGTTKFSLTGTLRQFNEIWQLQNVQEAAPMMELLKIGSENGREKGFESYAKETLKKTREYEKVFGNDSFKTLEWYETGLARCYAVARIGLEISEGKGTGFLVKGSVLSKKLDDNYVLLTNEHVVNDDEEVKDTLRSEDVLVIFEKVDPKEVFPVERIYWISERGKLDTAVLLFHKKDQDRINEIGKMSEPFPVARELPLVEDTQRIYIIGHPNGKTLSLSLQDNELLACEDPKIHYRTPTDGGSSGSPVFNRQWKLVGIHHKGKEDMPRLNGLPGTYKANEGIFIRTIMKAMEAEGK